MAEKTINKYLPHLKMRERPLALKSIPPFLTGKYNFYELLINQRPFLIIDVKDKELGPRQFKKHATILKEKIEYPQIWCLHKLHFHKVQRMIENGMNFIIEDKQVHLPSVNISITLDKQPVPSVTNRLNGLAVNMLIEEILQGTLSGKNKMELANSFSITQMTAGRAIERLLANDLCYERKEGISKYVHFHDKPTLWEYLKDKVENPVQEVVFFKQLPAELPYSGISALSERTMLADDRVPSFAINKKKFKTAYKRVYPVLEEFAEARVELWNRTPLLVENKCINPLDIYLTNKDDEDERVQIALEDLLKKHGLEKG